MTALAFSFAAMSGVMYDLKGEFLLDNAQVGLIGGAALWGMAISQIGFSSLCDVFGMRNLMRLACLGHVGGVLLFVTAGSFAGLFAGAWCWPSPTAWSRRCAIRWSPRCIVTARRRCSTASISGFREAS
ncbi:hypothetical protein ACFSTI_17545 [Rhizorhabdus histidinilytica]